MPPERWGMHDLDTDSSPMEQPIRLLARSADLPLYQQIRESLREQIRVGKLKPA